MNMLWTASLALVLVTGCHSMQKQSRTLLVPPKTANYPEMKAAILAFEKDASATPQMKLWLEKNPIVTLQTAAVVARQTRSETLMSELFKAMSITDAQRIAAFAPLLGSPDAISIATAKANLDGIAFDSPATPYVAYMAKNDRAGDLVDPITAYLFSNSRRDAIRRAIEMNKGVDDERMQQVSTLVDVIESADKSSDPKPAKSALLTLSEEKEWWLRGYVLMAMKQEPHLADKATIERLETDDNDRVYRMQKPWVNGS